tara:strand:- start:26 stop:466 length:441 start_codon:yes stop_codon:yes gene_type:complete
MSTRPSAQSTFTTADSVIIYSATNSDWRSVTGTTFLTWIKSAFAAPDPLTQTNVPVTGATLAIRDDGTSTWLLLLPAGTIATQTLTFPAVANCTDGQTINVSSSQTITTLTLAGNGATLVGSPSTIGATSPFTMKYDLASTTWYKA